MEQPTQAVPTPQITRESRGRQLTTIPWFSAILSVAAQVAIWWIYPSIYSKQLSAGQWQNNPQLLTYSVFLALTIFCVLHRQFKGLINYIFLLIPFILLYTMYQEMTGQQIVLLALLPAALVLIHFRWLNLQNILGLILFSGLSTLSLPVVIFYQQNTYLTTPFLLSLLPLLLSYLFFMTSLFIPRGANKRLTALAFGIMLLLNILTLPWSIWTLAAVLILFFTWLILINLNLRPRFRMATFSILQAITVLIIFLQQK